MWIKWHNVHQCTVWSLRSQPHEVPSPGDGRRGRLPKASAPFWAQPPGGQIVAPRSSQRDPASRAPHLLQGGWGLQASL